MRFLALLSYKVGLGGVLLGACFVRLPALVTSKELCTSHLLERGYCYKNGNMLLGMYASVQHALPCLHSTHTYISSLRYIFTSSRDFSFSSSTSCEVIGYVSIGRVHVYRTAVISPQSEVVWWVSIPPSTGVARAYRMRSQSLASNLLRWSCTHWHVASVLSDVHLSAATLRAENWALIRVL